MSLHFRLSSVICMFLRKFWINLSSQSLPVFSALIWHKIFWNQNLKKKKQVKLFREEKKNMVGRLMRIKAKWWMKFSAESPNPCQARLNVHRIQQSIKKCTCELQKGPYMSGHTCCWMRNMVRDNGEALKVKKMKGKY